MDSSRTAASAIMWISYLAVVGLSILSLGVWAILLAFVLMMPLLGAMGIMWSKEDIHVESSFRGFTIESGRKEKRKAVPIDALLDNFDDDDLEMLHEIVDDDEEIYSQR